MSVGSKMESEAAAVKHQNVGIMQERGNGRWQKAFAHACALSERRCRSDACLGALVPARASTQFAFSPTVPHLLNSRCCLAIASTFTAHTTNYYYLILI